MIELLDFWAEWCGPCKYLHPILDEVQADTGVPVQRIDVDRQTTLAQKYDVLSIPTVIVLKDGKELVRIVGAQPKRKYLEAIGHVQALSA